MKRKVLKKIKDVVLTTAGLIVVLSAGFKLFFKLPSSIDKINREKDWDKKSLWAKLQFIASLI